MLDVHAPEHPVHGVRDFFLHLFTITVGLLIALGLENIAEWRHHVHIRHEAEANIRRELESNRADLHSMLQAIPQEQKNLKQVSGFLASIREHHPQELHQVGMGLTETTLADASWATASATGALSYMEYAEVQRYAAAYQLQRKLDTLQDASLPEIVEIEAVLGLGDPHSASAEDLLATQHNIAKLMAHVETVREIGTALETDYNEALKEK